MENELFQMELTDEVEGVFAISLVPNPAIESDFIFLSKEKVTLAISDEYKRIVTGAVLIPDIQILRYDEDDKPYFITWDKPTIEASAFKFMNEYKQKSVTLDHVVKVPDVTVFESWIKDSDYDKSVGLGIDVPVGTWMTSMKINDDTLWDLVKKGIVKGFSIEGQFKPVPKEINNLKSEKMINEKKSANPIAVLKELLGIQPAQEVEAAEDPATPELPEPGTRWAFTEELYNDIVARLDVLEKAAMLSEAKPAEESNEEVKAEKTEEVEAEESIETAPVVDRTAEGTLEPDAEGELTPVAEVEASEEVPAEPEVKEPEMITMASNTKSNRLDRSKLSRSMSTEERIKAMLNQD